MGAEIIPDSEARLPLDGYNSRLVHLASAMVVEHRIPIYYCATVAR